MPILQFKVQSNYDEVVRLRQEIERLESTLRSFGPGTAESTIRAMEMQLAKTRAQFSALTDEAIRAGGAVEKSLQASMQRMKGHNEVTVKFKGDSTDFRKANEQVMRNIDDSLLKLQAYGQQMNGLFSRFAGLTGLTVAGMGVMEFANQIKNVRGEFQQYEVAFETMLGSAEKAKSLMSDLVQTAAITPFDLSGVTNGAKQLLAYGISAEDVNSKLIQLGDIAAGLSLSLGDLVYLYGTTITQGRMFTQDLRQFQGRGIPIAKELAKQFGVAESKVGELVTAGKVTSVEFTKAIESMAGAGGQFGGLMKKQSQTITGQISNIGDAIDSMFNEIGKSSEGVISSALSGTSFLIENWKEVGSVLATVTAAYAGFKLGDIINEKAFDLQFRETKDKLVELQRTARDFKLEDDIKQAVSKGQISVQEATEYQSARDELKKAGADKKTLDQLKEEAAQRIAVAEAMEAERQRLAALNEEYTKGKPKDVHLDDDISTQVNSGNATLEQAEELQRARDEMQKLADERQKAADAAGKEAEEYQELGKLYERDLEVAKQRKEKADEMVASIQQQMELQDAGLGNNDELVDQLDLESALREQAAAQTAVETAQNEVNSTAKLANAASSRQAALSEEAQTISRQAEAAATATNTAATATNTAAQGANTAAITRNSLAAKLAIAWDKAGAATKLILRNAVKSVTMSVRSLTAAIISNPVGMLITGITTAIGLFMTFRNTTEEASQEITRFGESAVKTKNNAETLYAVLASVSKGSHTYNEALSQLEKLAKEHNITLDAEKDKYEQLLEVRGKLIKLIMEEGRQRQIANNIEAIQSQKSAAIDEFRTGLTKNINEGTKDEQVKASTSVIVNTWLDSIESRRKELAEQIKELDDKERRLSLERAKGEYQDYEKSARLQSEITQARNRLMSEVNTNARQIMEAQGKHVGKDWKIDLNDAYQSLKKLVVATGSLNAAMEGYTKSMEQTAATTESLKTPPKIDYTQLDVKGLTDKLKEATQTAKELSKMVIKPEANPVSIHELIETAKKAQGQVEQTDKASASPSTDNSQLEATQTEAQKAEKAINEVDNTTATPRIDTKYLDIALSTLDKIKVALRDVGGQVLNTTGEERIQLQELIKKYGKNGKIEAGTKMAKADAELYNRIVAHSRLRSNIKFGGKAYQLNSEQAALLQQLIDSYGTKLDESKMDEANRRIFRQLKNDLLVADYNSRKADNAQTLKDIKEDFDRRLSAAKTTEEFSNLRREIQAQQNSIDQDSELYKYFKDYLQKLNKKDKSKTSGKGDDPKQRAYDIAKSDAEKAKRIAELKAKAEQDAEDLIIASMKEGTEREIREIHNEAKKKRAALDKERQQEADKLKEEERQSWMKRDPKKNKAYNWKPGKSDDEYRAEAGANIGYDTQLAEIAFNESAALEKTYKEELTSMRDHLKEYGTFKQRKLAMEQEYARKIAEARNDGERATYEAEKRKALDGIEAEAITAQIDWYSVFDNVGIVMKGQLEPLYQQLQSYVQTDAFRSSGADNQKAVIDAMQKLREQLGTGNTSWTELASSLTAYQAALDGLRTATEEDMRITAEMGVLMSGEDAAERALKSARNNLAQGKGTQAQVDAAQAVYDQAHQAVQNFGATVNASALAVQKAKTNVSSTGMLLSQTAVAVTQPVSDITTFLQNSGIPRLGELWASFDKLQGGIDGLKALSELKKAADAAKDGAEGVEDVAEDVKNGAEKVGEVATEELIDGLDKAGLIAQVISAALSILDILKDGIGTLISDVIDTVLNAITGILENILSGTFIQQIGESLYKGVGGIFKSITTLGGLFDWWGGGESDPELEKDIERLTLTNEALRKAIEGLTDEMRDASIGDIKTKYEQAREKYEAAQSNTQEMMSREGAAYNNGFLGVGGKKSSNKKINDAMSGNEWSRISEKAGRSVRSAADFWSLTSEQMAKVAKDAPDLYAKIKQYADEGYKDASQYMDQYVSYYEELEDLQTAYYEALTNVSLDSVKDEFKSLLGNMESTAEDFADSFEKMMQQAVINAFVNDIFANQIEAWYDDFVKAMESGDKLTAAEQTQLQREWDNMVNDALEQRKALSEAMGWDETSSQQSYNRSISAISQDTGDAIEGRLTAIQIATEAIRTSEEAGAISLAKITDEMLTFLDKHNAATQHYENIEHQIASCFLELVAISENTGAIVKPIQEMRSFLNEMNKKL